MPGTPAPEPESTPTSLSQRAATGMVIVGFAALGAVVLLGLTGHPEAAAAASPIGVTALTVSGINARR
ncbi:hypothetical protein [Streptomyces venezuelae]|uniref:hypothetical protein n=1 Tax=Streptomyces venezuelae TaxID=54571 RepID=UPI0009039A8C|nr:hypothetical protein [Streptomyces venezuelae]APE26800.1 hypothetical protein vnz_37500 [Streptomyces venezuelae]